MSDPEIITENPITEGVIWKQLLKFFFPIMIGTFFQQLYNTADAIIVGQFLGKAALAATGGSTAVLFNLFVMFFTNLSSGASVVISQYYGAKKSQEVQDTLHTAIALALTSGLILTVIGILGTPIALQLMNSPADVYPLATTYLQCYFTGIISVLIYNIGSAILRAVGDSKRPLYYLIVSCFINIVLDLLFVAVIPWGIAGAAYATVIAQTISAILVMYRLISTDQIYKLYPKKIRFHWGLLKRIVSIGLPAGIQGSMFSISNLIIQSTLNGLGTDVIAAWTSFSKLNNIFWMGSNAFGIAIMTFSGQNYGAGHFDRIKKSSNICLLMHTIYTAAMMTFFLLCGRYFLLMFTSDQAVLTFGQQIIWGMVPYYIGYIFVEIYSGAIRGTGHTLIPMLLTLFGTCILRILWILLYIPSHRTLAGVLISYPFSWIFTSVLFIVYYHRGKWLRH